MYRPANETFLTSPDGDKRVPNQFCKAAGKLAEALAVTGFTPRSGRVAIDVGAAPGGWTQILAQRMQLVIAVDPAELHPEVQAMPNVRHIQKMSQDSVEDVAHALKQNSNQGEPNSTTTTITTETNAVADLLVCDMNRHPDQALEILSPLFEALCPGGLCVWTLKFRGKARRKEQEDKAVKGIEEAGFENVKVYWFLANTQHERTVVATKK